LPHRQNSCAQGLGTYNQIFFFFFAVHHGSAKKLLHTMSVSREAHDLENLTNAMDEQAAAEPTEFRGTSGRLVYGTVSDKSLGSKRKKEKNALAHFSLYLKIK
jgi:hypothetical protein